MELIVDIGNFRMKGALFERDVLTDFFILPLSAAELKPKIENRRIDRSLISSVNDPIEKEVHELFDSMQVPYQLLDYSKLRLVLDVEESQAVGHDRIANVYGALFHFPQHDCFIKVLATRGATRKRDRCPSDEHFLEELSDLVDLIDPELTLNGLHEILKELQYGKR